MCPKGMAGRGENNRLQVSPLSLNFAVYLLLK